MHAGSTAADAEMWRHCLEHSDLVIQLNGGLGEEIRGSITDLDLVVVDMPRGNNIRVYPRGRHNWEAADLEVYRRVDGTLTAAVGGRTEGNKIEKIGQLNEVRLTARRVEFHPVVFAVIKRVLNDHGRPSTGLLLDGEYQRQRGLGLTAAEGAIIENWLLGQDDAFLNTVGMAAVEDRVTQLIMERMVDPASVSLTLELTGGLNGRDYNRVHLNRGVLADMYAGGNPGIATMVACLEYLPDGCALDHPGDAVRIVRNDMEASGLDRHYWKSLAALEPNRVRAVVRNPARNKFSSTFRSRLGHVGRDLAMIFNAVGESRVSPSDEAIEKSTDLYWKTDYLDLEDVQKRAKIQRIMALLMADESAGGRKSPKDEDTISDIREFVLRSEGMPRARYWHSLDEAASRWWEEEAARQDQEEFWNRVHSYGGWYYWTSVIDEVQIGQYKFKALNDEFQLLQEGVAQRNCVFHRRHSCMDHSFRLFSVRLGDQRISTTELQFLYWRGWKAHETKAKRNAPVGKGLLSAVETLAEMYDEAFRQAGSYKAHRTWLEKSEPGQWKQNTIGVSHR